MQIIIKTFKMIKNKWVGAIWTSISFNDDFLDLWWSFSYFMAQREHCYWTWTDILIYRWSDIVATLETSDSRIRGNMSVIIFHFWSFSLHATWVILNNQEFIFWLSLETLWPTSPSWEFFLKSQSQFLAVIVP